MKIALFGTGQMGTTISHFVKRVRPECTITAYDQLSECPAGMKVDNYETLNVQVGSCGKNPLEGKKFDLAFSALPYFCNLAVANLCLTANVPYFDLGGSVPVSDNINYACKHSRKKKASLLGRPWPEYIPLFGSCPLPPGTVAIRPTLHGSVFTDLGLAPGWANILAEEAYRNLMDAGELPEHINMYCGGLPAEPYAGHIDPFGYAVTWSKEGLYNEYVDKCLVLEGGETVSYDGMEGLEVLRTVELGVLEAFFTSGGASHTIDLMADRGVENCSYKTLRYPGHCNLIRYFIRERGYDANGLVNLFTDHAEGDVIILQVRAKSRNLEYCKSHLIRSDEQFSAMQKATAAGFVAGALSSPQANRPLTYADIDIKKFNGLISELGVLQ